MVTGSLVMWKGSILLLLSSLPCFVSAFTKSVSLDETWASHQRCVEMRGQADGAFWPTSESSLILSFEPGYTGIVSTVLFELGDEHLGGVRRPGTNEKEVLCTPENIQRSLCSTQQLHEFLISDEARERARHPFLTRAVNLTKPVALMYPVARPGYYCAATVLSSGEAFSASLRVIEPETCLPAFRVGLLTMYRWLGPVWIIIAVVWAARHLDLPSPRRRSRSVFVLAALSAVQVTIRWLGLEICDDGVRTGLAGSWTILEAVQNSGVVFGTYQLADRLVQQASVRVRWFAYGVAAVTLALELFGGWADHAAHANSRGSGYINIFRGLLLLNFCGVLVVVLIARKGNRQGKSMLLPTVEYKSETSVFAAVVAAVGFLFAGHALVNAWALAVPRTPLEFAHHFWQSRFWLFDGAHEVFFVIWIFGLMVFSTWSASNDHHSTTDELTWPKARPGDSDLRSSTSTSTDETRVKVEDEAA